MARTLNETRNQHGEPVRISNLGIVVWRRPRVSHADEGLPDPA